MKDLSAVLSSKPNLDALLAIEGLIKSKIVSEAADLRDISSYLLELGGKRVRPLLAILVGRLLRIEEPYTETAAGQKLLDVAAGIELIHMATLLHDDIIDKSMLRRHKESPLAKFGSDKTLLCGDFLLTRAFGLCARLDRFIIDATEQACVHLTEGEILEVPLHLGEHTLESSLEIARKKTAALFRLAALSAAHLAGVPQPALENLSEFGEKLGISFQILDDVLDVTSTIDLLGKKTGQDLEERKPSVVNVLWLASGSGLAKTLRTPPAEDGGTFREAALKELQGGKIVETARTLAADYARQAGEALQRAAEIQTGHCPETLQALQLLSAYVLERLK